MEKVFFPVKRLGGVLVSLVILISHTALAAAADTAPDTPDWVPLSLLPPKAAAARGAQLCEGRYVEPAWPGSNFAGKPDEAPVYLEADSLSAEGVSKGELKGHVVVRQGYRQITGDKARYSDPDQVDVKGHAVLREPGRLLTGNEMHANTRTGTASITDAGYLLHQNGLRGKAGAIERDAHGVIHLRDATYTRCPPAAICAWQLTGQQVTLNPETGLGTARHGVLSLAGLPVLYAPWMTFPLDDRRRSGFLAPRLAFSLNETGNGLDYTQPWYWNIAPNMDATVSPRVMSQRGASLNGQFRYLYQTAQGELEGEASTPDQLKKENPYHDQNRWFVDWQHQQRWGPAWDWRVRYTQTSDKAYFFDLGNGTRAPGAPAHRETYITRRSRDPGSHQWNLSLGTQYLENLNRYQDALYSRPVDLALNGHWHQGGDPLRVDYRFTYASFQRERDWRYLGQKPADPATGVAPGIWGRGTGIANATGQRLQADIRSRYRMENRYGFLEPGLRLRSTSYWLDGLDQNFVDSAGSTRQALRPSTTAPSLHLDAGLFLERPMPLAADRGTWTLEPRLRYLYTPWRTDQAFNPAFTTTESPFSYASLWSDDRFSDSDRLGDANQLSLGLSSRLLAASGLERFHFGIGQILYFRDRRVFLTSPALSNQNSQSVSPLATQAVWKLNRQLELRQDWTFSTGTEPQHDYRLGLRYQPGSDSLFKLSYRYKEQPSQAALVNPPGAQTQLTDHRARNRLEAIDGSLVLPLSLRWRAMTRQTYDITHRRYMEKLLGVERDACCYMMRFLYRSWIDPDKPVSLATSDQGIFFEFVLKGLGRMTGGGQISSVLGGIEGYRKAGRMSAGTRTDALLKTLDVHGHRKN